MPKMASSDSQKVKGVITLTAYGKVMGNEPVSTTGRVVSGVAKAERSLAFSAFNACSSATSSGVKSASNAANSACGGQFTRRPVASLRRRHSFNDSMFDTPFRQQKNGHSPRVGDH
jgi:hypothetical protein